MARIIEAKAVISGEDHLSKVLDGLQKKFKEVGRGAKAATEVGRLGKEIDAAAKGMRDLERFRGAQGSFAQARTAFRSTQTDVARIAKELEAARKAAAAFDGIRTFSKSGGMAQEMASARKNVADLERQLTTAQRAVKAASTAYDSQAAALKGVKGELAGSGTSVGKLVAEQHRLKAAIEGTNAAILRQEAVAHAEGRMTAGMGAAGSGVAARIAQGRRLTDGMGVAGRAHREQQEQATREAQEAIDIRQAAIRDARSTLLGGAGVYLGHKIHEGTHSTLETYRHFDQYKRQTQAFGNFSDEEMGRIVDMAIHGGASSRYNDIQWLQGAKALGGRGVKSGSVMGILPEAAQYGQAMGVTLPEAVAGLEGSLFTFRRDLSTPEKATAAARRTADLQVTAAKAFGLTHDDLKGGYEYGGLAAEMSGLGEEKLLAFLGLGKKLNIDGMTQGNAFNAMTSKFLSPTKKGREALASVGIDYGARQQMPDRLSVDNFATMIAQQYGAKLDSGARSKLDKAFGDKSVFSDPAAFAVAVKEAVKGQVGVTDAKSANKVVGSAERFRQTNVEKVDVNGLWEDIMEKVKGGNLALANMIWGDKQGKRVMAAMRDGDVWREALAKVEHAPEGKARKVATDINAGYDGQMARLEGAKLNVESRIGNSLDPALTKLTGKAADVTQAFAELPSPVLAAGASLAYLGGKASSILGGSVLMGTSTGLTYGALSGGASAASVASLAIGTLTVATIAAAALAVTAPLVFAADNDKALVHGGKPDITMNPGDELPGLDGSTSKPSWAQSTIGPNRPSVADGVPSLIDAPRKNAAASIEDARQALGRYRKELEGLKSESDALSDLGLPGIGGGDSARKAELERQVRTAEERLRALRPPTDPTSPESKSLPATSVPLPPARPPEFGGDPGGILATLRNTLENVTAASAAAANGGKPVEATVKPDQITAKVMEIPPVTGEATVTLQPQRIQLEINSDMVRATAIEAARSVTAKIPLASSGARPGAVSMPGAATTPGDQ